MLALTWYSVKRDCLKSLFEVNAAFFVQCNLYVLNERDDLSASVQ